MHYLSFILSKRFQSFILSVSKLEHLHNSYFYDQYFKYGDNHLFFSIHKNCYNSKAQLSDLLLYIWSWYTCKYSMNSIQNLIFVIVIKKKDWYLIQYFRFAIVIQIKQIDLLNANKSFIIYSRCTPEGVVYPIWITSNDFLPAKFWTTILPKLIIGRNWSIWRTPES